ncbi:E3 ubiquitin-protein ligase SIAH1B-like [Centruroides sculpturatus]|uniref:E3 ubiquitin-protein ligase SIAH1B-like n=1 Tax=Centruroides sculpturatus TaxID=218467 RepID=UPI000C6D81B3|nr:E3 ubiquitin-protein ligase SIAH1B-like [Centruroides sculpturatus]
MTSTERSNPALVEMSTCPICYTLVQPPIYQCSNGHIVCYQCRERITQCPTCRETLGYIRCLFAEQIVQTLEAPCSNQPLGCPEILPSSVREEHERNCRFRPIVCPVDKDQCTWTGGATNLESHLIQAHHIPIVTGNTLLFLGVDTQINAPVTWAALLKCFNHQFLITVKKQNLFRPSYTFQTQILPPFTTTSKFNCIINFRRGGIHLRWTSIHFEPEYPTTTTIPVLELLESTLQLFCDGNNFKCTLTISHLNN